MPSGWTTSGIDWSSVDTMRNSRTEDIVRQVYFAVNEYDHWIRTFSMSNVTDIDFDGRMRTENQYYYIYNTVKDWLTPFSDLPNTNRLNSQCCFLDESSNFNVTEITGSNYYTFFPAGRWFGFKNLDYSEGGTLENMISADFSLLRNNERGRISLQFLYDVYKLLNKNLKIAMGQSSKTTSYGAHGLPTSYFTNKAQNESFFRTTYNKGRLQYYNRFATAQDAIDDTIDRFNNDVYLEWFYTIPTISSLEDMNLKGESYGTGANITLRTTLNYISYLGKGDSGSVFNINLADVIVKSYGYLYKTNTNYKFFDYFPKGDRPIGANSYSPSIESVDGQSVFQISSKITEDIPYITVPSGSDVYEGNFRDNAIPFLCINKQEGFLRYYAESN